ncbi:MAG: hypothetical protein HKN47_21800 [Pirellulaceae bacterium]|nr:hypothetical protein [Pirellulaceae bacterium]
MDRFFKLRFALMLTCIAVAPAALAQELVFDVSMLEENKPQEPELPADIIRKVDFQKVLSIANDAELDGGTNFANSESVETPPLEPVVIEDVSTAANSPKVTVPIAVVTVETSGMIDDVSHQETPQPAMISKPVYQPVEMPIAPQQIASPIACDQCQGANVCGCQAKRKFQWSWNPMQCWRQTELYRLHVQNLGDPSMKCVRPFGSCNESFATAMIISGKSDRAMLHHYDFTQQDDNSVNLTARGVRELHRIAQLTQQYPVNLSIETTHRADIDEARMLVVMNAIADLQLPIATETILVHDDHSVGLSGPDAEAIHVIRLTEAVTGATRTRGYSNTSGATTIPFVGNDNQ